MSAGGKKNVKVELKHCVSCFGDHSKSSSLQELPEVIARSPCLPVHTHTCTYVHIHAHTEGGVQFQPPLRGSLLVRAPSWTKMPFSRNRL